MPASVKRAYVGRAARAGARDDLGLAVAGDIGAGNRHAAVEPVAVGEEAADLIPGLADVVNTFTWGPPPGPAPTMSSSRASPITSAKAIDHAALEAAERR